jgi:putative SOS response-associated peptidase YedK
MSVPRSSAAGLEPDERLWLDPAMTETELVLPLLRLYPSEAMTAWAVRPLVNRVTNDGPELLVPA